MEEALLLQLLIRSKSKTNPGTGKAGGVVKGRGVGYLLDRESGGRKEKFSF